jgi:hypothetical protein
MIITPILLEYNGDVMGISNQIWGFCCSIWLHPVEVLLEERLDLSQHQKMDING